MTTPAAKQMVGPGCRYWVGGLLSPHKGSPWSMVCPRSHGHSTRADALRCIEGAVARLQAADINPAAVRT